MVYELKTWMFQCDSCNYTGCVKTVLEPDHPPGWERVSVSAYNKSWNALNTFHVHYCSACIRNRKNNLTFEQIEERRKEMTAAREKERTAITHSEMCPRWPDLKE